MSDIRFGMESGTSTPIGEITGVRSRWIKRQRATEHSVTGYRRPCLTSATEVEPTHEWVYVPAPRNGTEADRLHD